MITMKEPCAEWHKTIRGVLQIVQQCGADWQIEGDFYTAMLAFLEGQAPSLLGDHSYAAALAHIKAGFVAGGGQDEDDTASENDEPLLMPKRQ